MKPEWIVLIVIGSILIVYLVCADVLYSRLFLRKHYKSVPFVDHTLPFFQPSKDWYDRSPKEEVSIRGYDGVKLTGVFLPSYDEKSTQTAIVLHGYQSQASDMIVIGKMYNDMGFKVLLVNLRGHGESEGDFTTFGHYEKQDLKKWIHFALRTYGSTDKILLHGVSLGAATVMLSQTTNIPENVKLIVADCGFTTLTKMLIHNIKPRILLLFLPGINLFTYYNHRFLLSSVSPLKAVVKGRIPLFIYHGTADSIIPFSMGTTLVEASKAPFKELYPIENAEHAQGYVVDKPGLEKRIFELVCKYFTIKKSVMKQMK